MPADTHQAMVIFRSRLAPEEAGLSRVQAAQMLTERNRRELLEWIHSRGLETQLNGVSEASVLGAIAVRASQNLLREIEDLPQVEMVVRE